MKEPTMSATTREDLACPHVALRDDGGPMLMGSRCADCGEPYFPPAAACTRCLSRHLQPAEIGDRGTLWSWTVQAFLPKTPYDGGETPESFVPYGVGYVEMPSGIKVEARLSTADETRLRIGMPMRLELAPYGTAGGLTFVFRPEE
jgi:uncharacterized protein